MADLNSFSCELIDAQATERLGAVLAPVLPKAAVVALEGPLGAGKTTLVRGLLRALGHAGRVRSPSYSLLERYDFADQSVLHLDLYRLLDPAELEYLALREQLDARTLVLVEWPQRALGALPAPTLEITLAYTDGGRRAVLRATSAQAADVVVAVAARWEMNNVS